MKPLTTINCPSCGAGHEIFNPGVITVVCDYCGNAVYWDQEKIKDAGKQSVLPEGFSRLYRGAAGTMFNKRFVVLGRVRYSFGKGFWDEWYLEFSDNTTGWLSEDNHEFAWEIKTSGMKVPEFSKLSPGFELTVKSQKNNIRYIIEEVGYAECLGLEGELPREIQSGEKYAYADGSSPDGHYTIGIEYDEDPPTVFLGRWIKYASLKMDDEGLEW